MKAWVTGAGGFMGVHLVNYLIEKNYRLLATYYNPTTDIKDIDKKAIIKECDVRDKEKVFSLMKEFNPEKIFHLAAQSYPTVSWENPWYTIESNIIGTINIFEALKKFNKNCKILNAGSSGEYGHINEKDIPVKEKYILKPLHPYGVSKVAQELLAYQYFQNFKIPSITIRIFNTTGPRKINDVCSDFTKRLIEIEKGINKEKILRVGNLKTKRAITDVRDVIKAFDLALDKATIGEVYNISGEKAYEINEIIEVLRSLVNFEFEIFQDKELLRTTDEPIIFGNSTKFKLETNWKQEIPLEKTLKDMLEHWRGVL